MEIEKQDVEVIVCIPGQKYLRVLFPLWRKHLVWKKKGEWAKGEEAPVEPK